MNDTILVAAGLATILAVLAGILSKRLSPLVALTLIPFTAAILLGKGAHVGQYMLDGLVTVAPMAAMFVFAILFFALLADARLFEPAILAVKRFAGDHPARIALGTAILASIVQLDGSGAVTFLVVVPALVPVYDRLGLDRRMLACVVAMAAGVGNMLPWGGPTLRAATALSVPVMDLFGPMIPVYLTGLGGVLAFSWWLGSRQRVVLATGQEAQAADAGSAPEFRLGWRFWVNVVSVVAVLAAMLIEIVPPAIAFLLGVIVALLVNFPDPEQQGQAIERHAPAAFTMVAILFAAGSFTGIMQGSGMIDALAGAGANLLPGSSAQHLPVVTAVLSMPLSLFFDPDSFYFGILPLLGGVAEHAGVPAMEVGRAAIIGQMTTGFPVSPMTPATFLLVGLAGIDLADHQRYTIPYLFALSLLMTVAALLLGVIRL